ncbi:MAG: metallophosphoesterase [Novosphingobium sp.]|nr:metallophosphoesterase [Novosphingobium sp.]
MTNRLRITVVLTVLFLLYAGIQLYAVAKAQAAFALPGPVAAGLVVWVGLMTVLPLLLWRLERRGGHRLVVTGAWVGYSWMGLAFLFFWIALGVDLLALAARLWEAGPRLTPRQAFLLANTLTLGVAGYGFAVARRPRIERVTLTTPKLPEPLRIVLLSDVHLGAMLGRRRLRRILARVRELDPDLLLSAGDLVDGQTDRLNGLAPQLAELAPRLGKFAVTGNHEFFAGIERALDFHARAGFTVLRGTAVEIGALTIAGVDDPTGAMLGVAVHRDEHALLAGRRPGFTILLKHQPVVDPWAAGRFDLQLSGHVHHGQIFPFGLLVRLSYPMATGLTRLAGGWLYVSRGTGTWGPPLRVLAPPEITLIELRPAQVETLSIAASNPAETNREKFTQPCSTKMVLARPCV